MGKYILTVFLYLIVCRMAGQTSYYIDPVIGNDANNGMSLVAPWRTIQKACNTAVPNSIVWIKGGTYSENIQVNVSGTIDDRIVFKNFNNEPVIIDGTGTTGTSLLSLINKSYLTFENLIFQNVVVNHAKGIHVEVPLGGYSTGLIFRNLKIRNIKWTADASEVANSNDNANGFLVYGTGPVTNLTIDGCEISDNILGRSEALTLNGNVSGFTIKNCIIHDNNNIGIDLAGNYGVSSVIAEDHARSGLVQNNICYGNVSPYSTAAGIYVDGGQDILIERNTCFENSVGIEVGCEKNGTTLFITVKNNMIFNNADTGLAVGGFSALTNGQVLASTFRNNTFFRNNSLDTGAGEISLTKASNCIFEDNLFYTNSQNILMSVSNIEPQNGNLFNYNCWFTPSSNPDNITIYWKALTFSTFSSYKIGTFQESNSIYSDPGTISPLLSSLNLQLGNSSPCINTGNPLLSITPGETDYNGNPRIVNGLIDIGAEEFQTSLGVSNQTAISPSTVYPNPFSDVATIFSAVDLHDAHLDLFDNTGKLVSQNNGISGNRITLGRQGLSSGLYLYQIVMDNRTIAKGKVIIN